MRAVIQRVTSASVVVRDGASSRETGRIGAGLVVLLGVTHDDGPEQVQAMARKIAELRILDGERSAMDTAAPILLVSQFTLYADVRKGRRPSWNAAAPRAIAEPIVADVVAELTAKGLSVCTGEFGEHMEVALVNDGPVTIIVDV